MGTRVLIKLRKGKWADQLLKDYHHQNGIVRKLQISTATKKDVLTLEVFKTWKEVTVDPEMAIVKELSYYPEF